MEDHKHCLAQENIQQRDKIAKLEKRVGELEATGCERRVIDKIVERQKAGIVKYGVHVQDNPLSKKEWLVHAQDEALDLSIYLQRLIEME